MNEAKWREILQLQPLAASVIDPKTGTVLLCNRLFSNLVVFSGGETVKAEGNFEAIMSGSGFGMLNFGGVQLPTVCSLQDDVCYCLHGNLIRENEAHKAIERIDLMTGIGNREAGLDSLNKQLQSKGEFTVSYIRLKNIYIIRTEFGEIAADEYILRTVDVLRESIRSSDQIARMRSNEFLIIFPRCRFDVAGNIMGTIGSRIEAISSISGIACKLEIEFKILEFDADSKLSVNEIVSELEK